MAFGLSAPPFNITIWGGGMVEAINEYLGNVVVFYNNCHCLSGVPHRKGNDISLQVKLRLLKVTVFIEQRKKDSREGQCATPHCI